MTDSFDFLKQPVCGGWEPSEELGRKIQQHALDDFPRESCGVVISRNGREYYKRTKNTAEDQTRNARWSCKEEEGEKTIALCHSHPGDEDNACGPAFPSKTDMKTCQRANLPGVLIPVSKTGALAPVLFGPKTPRPALLGRRFLYGVNDCYSLIRDYFWKVLGVELRDYPRSWEFWKTGESLYEENFEKEDFSDIQSKDLKVHDIIFMTIRAKVINHAAIYLGDGTILHHLGGITPQAEHCLSAREPVTRYLNCAVRFARYQK